MITAEEIKEFDAQSAQPFNGELFCAHISEKYKRYQAINSYDDIAEETGLSVQTIFKCVHGRTKRFDINTVLKLCKWLNKPVEFFEITNP